MTYRAREKEKPIFAHAIVLGFAAVVLALFLASHHAWDLMARICSSLLNLAGVQTEYVSQQFLMYIRLPDGSIAGFQVLAECSGLITLAVFTFISAFTVGLLKGALATKLIWFTLSLAVGFLWNVSRLASVVAIAHAFSLSGFSFAHYVLAPTVDFVWVVSLWTLGMFLIKRKGREAS